MFIGTHTCAPVLLALTVDALRLKKGRDRLFPSKHLVAIGIAGALPDLLHPHFALSARYSSWTHTLWFILAIYPVFGFICRTWFRSRWLLLTHWLWLSTVAHLATDTLANGTRPLYPYGPVINFNLIPFSVWIRSELIIIPTTVLLFIWVKRHTQPSAGKSRVLTVLLTLAVILMVLFVAAPIMNRLRLNLNADPAAKFIAMERASHDLKPNPGVQGTVDVRALIEPIRAKFRLPSLAAVVLKNGEVVGQGVCGVRKRGGTEAATLQDPYLLGWNTMSMTATLMAVLVEEGRLNWTTTVGEVFGATIQGMDPGWKMVTLEQMLNHQVEVAINMNTFLWMRMWMARGDPIKQRMKLTEIALEKPPASARGNQNLFPIIEYVIAGAMAEKATGQAWEKLMQEKVLRPLGITSAGFGRSDEEGNSIAMQGHNPDGTPVDWKFYASMEPALGPSETLHMTITDLAKYARAHLRGDSRNPKREITWLKAASYDKLHMPAGDFALGWYVSTQAWAKGSGTYARGLTLAHSGIDLLDSWHCTILLAPERDFGLLLATNQGGNNATRAMDELAQALGKKFNIEDF
jgi:CubicO group peptidase (beta-lactamase class C family)